MDKIQNPFSPGAGSPPPELAGRDEILESAAVLLGRVKAKRSEKSMLLTGLRGVGKTVLLNRIQIMAVESGYLAVSIEAHEGKSLAVLLAPHLRGLLYALDRVAGAKDKVKRGIAVLKSFIGAVKVSVGEIDIGLDIEPELGSADTGDIEIDLPNLLIAVAEAAEEKGAAVVLLIDEIQYFSSRELSGLIMGMHKMQQRQLPFVLVGAGLSVLPGLAGESKSYAERLFSFPDVGALSLEEAFKAIREPIEESNESIDEEALSEIYRLTQGYPYFLQEWGYQAWNHALKSPISINDINRTTKLVTRRLDENFFRVRYDRLTPKEKELLRSMAELGSGPYKFGDIVELLNLKSSQLSPARASLIKKGMVYSPVHGQIAFTVPLFDKFLRRTVTDVK